MWRGAPLWLRLVCSLLGLAALALVLNAVVGARLLRSHLLDRLDTRLQAVAAAVGDDLPAASSSELPSPYYLTVVSPAGRIVDERWAPLDPDAPAPALPSLTLDDVRALGGEPFTVDGGDGGWRAVARPLGERAGSVVVAQSLADIDATVGWLGRASTLAGIALLGALAAATYLVVRRALGPLPGIEQAALALTDGERAARAPETAAPGSELGRIARAFNTMAERLDAAILRHATSEDAARQARLRLRQFVADATHELRAPLMSLRSFTDIHRHGTVTDATALSDVLRQIERESQRMGQLVDDLLLLARLDQGRPLAEEPVDIAAAARDAADAARVVAPDRAIVFVGPEEPLVVTGEEVRLRHALSNLVDNAVIHTTPGTPIEIAVGRTRRDGRDWAVLEVRDHGPGLAPEQAERVFDRFYRGNEARERLRSGSGLGLAIVDAIVGAHGGVAEVDASAGPGTTFRVLLPLEAGAAPSALVPVSLAPGGAPPAGARAPGPA